MPAPTTGLGLCTNCWVDDAEYEIGGGTCPSCLSALYDDDRYEREMTDEDRYDRRHRDDEEDA